MSKLLVAKFGTRTIGDPESGRINEESIDRHSRTIGQIAASGYDVVVVSSGARAYGQPEVFSAWQKALYGATGKGAIEYFLRDFSSREIHPILGAAILGDGTPIVNMDNKNLDENNPHNDNDRVGHDIVMHAAGNNWYSRNAIKFVMVTNSNGLLDRWGDREPILNESTDLSHIENISSPDNASEGGIASKVKTGREIAEAGVAAYIADGRVENSIPETIAGKIGTHIAPKEFTQVPVTTQASLYV